MIFFVNQISDPYRRTDFTLELKILIFVHGEMKFDLYMGLKMENATCAFVHLASTSSSVPPVVVIRLPRYVKADTCSRTSSTQLMLPVFAGDRILISLVLDALILRPTLAACSTSAANFCLMCMIFWLSKTISSAKSESSNFCNEVNWISRLVVSKSLSRYPVQCYKEEKGAKQAPVASPSVHAEGPCSFTFM